MAAAGDQVLLAQAGVDEAGARRIPDIGEDATYDF